MKGREQVRGGCHQNTRVFVVSHLEKHWLLLLVRLEDIVGFEQRNNMIWLILEVLRKKLTQFTGVVPSVTFSSSL